MSATSGGRRPVTARGALFAALYGVAASYIFCFSGAYGSVGRVWWRDVLLVVVSVTAAAALTYIALLVTAFLRGSAVEPGDVRALSWHLLVPCRDEESVIAATVSAARTSFPDANVWVIDDGSDDATASIVQGLMDFDPRVHLVSRRRPHARTGKGDALNTAYAEVSAAIGGDPVLRTRSVIGVLDADGYLSENALALLAGPEGFANPSVGAVQLEVRMKNRNDRRPLPREGRLKNLMARFLVRMQDMEFRTSNSAMQLVRIGTGTVGMGGNGQFTRLTVLDALAERQGTPWGRKLAEDYELGLNILSLGFTNHYLRDAHVSQEALPRFGALVRQRTRWAQGNLECTELLKLLRSSGQLSRAGLVEIHYFMAQPWILMVNLLGVPLLAYLAFRDGSLDLTHQVLAVAGVLFLIAPYVMWGPLYRMRGGERIGAVTSVALGLGYLVYVYFTYVYYPLAVTRLITGQSSWMKTARNADGRTLSTALPSELERVPVLEVERVHELADELGGSEQHAMEVVAAYAVIWPRRLAQLEQSVSAEDRRASRDAAASIRAASLMVGAERLAQTAQTVTSLVDGADFDGARESLDVVTVVGSSTVEALRGQFLRNGAPGNH
ncbi:glycosyltransferase [Aestuariimicrobium kwangyangense]|uniref:glycosyltransferase n=1 Tax=Aestuariimicrobium kwangyangense TaxID=396389 RepID=UPI00041A2D12|nr:glycosyltransferase [Aestuariimicrobium kwangyangense]